MRIIDDVKYDYSDLLIVPKRSSLGSRKDVELTRVFTFLNSNGHYSGVPLIAANMDQTGTFEMAIELSKFGVSTAIHKHYSADELIKFFSSPVASTVFYTMGIGTDDYVKFKTVYSHENVKINAICIDVANGYTSQFETFVSKMRDDYPDIIIMAGSVVTPEMTAGADLIKCGIGSGSVCTTRKKTGVGYPQLSAVIECSDAAHGLNGHLVADGGCTLPGDISKAFGAGADFVMLGGMLAGHEECNGVRETIDDVEYMKFYGMSSKDAMDAYSNGVATYRSAEGKSVLIPYRGKVEDTILEILGGIRSTCTYVGAKTLKELSKRTTFIKVNQTHNTIFGDE